MATYLPRSLNGSMLVTTRDKRVAERLSDRQVPLSVLPMKHREAEELLKSKFSGFCNTNETDSILEALGYLPLAISQAGAFMSENSMSIADYLEILQSGKSEIQDVLSRNLGDHRRYGRSKSGIMSTWKLSFDKIGKQQARAAEILSLMAMMDRNGIPKKLLLRESESIIDFTLALGTLQAFSLIEAEEGGSSFRMHRLVQLSTQRWLELQDTEIKYQEEALKLLSERFPRGDFENWNICDSLSLHAQAVLNYPLESKESRICRAKLLHNLARFDDSQARYELAHSRFMEAISIRKELLGPEHMDTLQSMGFFGEVLLRETKLKEGEQVIRTALSGIESILGKDHPETLMSIGRLAEIIQGLGRYEEAEGLYRQALIGREVDLGTRFEDMKNADNLGSVLRDQKRYSEAEDWIRRAMLAREKSLGPKHLDTIRSVSHLALTLRLSGSYIESKALNQRAVATYEEIIGREHPFTLSSLNNLAVLFRCMGRYEEAEEYGLQALQGLRGSLGPKHQRTLACLKELGLLYQEQKRYGDAEAIVREVLDGEKVAIGCSSHETGEYLSRIVELRNESTMVGVQELSLGASGRSIEYSL